MRNTLELLTNCAKRFADRDAVIDGDDRVTYGEFYGRVARLAGSMAAVGVPSPKVLINLPQSIDAYAAMFATHMAGGIYCPLNIEYPVNRKRQILKMFEPDLIITRANLEDGLATNISNSRLLNLENLTDNSPLGLPLAAHELAYVMFTSGSTGQPKGVMIGQNALSHYIDWAGRAMAITPYDRWSQHPNIGFDLSVLDIYGALCHGACLYPIKGVRGRLVPAECIDEFQLTIWNSVPSVVDVMAKRNQLTSANLASLRLMTFCGEPLLPEHLDRIFAARPDIKVHNTYGPTETTVSCTLLELTAQNYRKYCRNNVSFGEPIEGMTLTLESRNNQSEGEIIISGPQVAHGYWGRPDLTDQVFSKKASYGGGRNAYRTGDWAEYIDDNLYFKQRVDRQIKRRGHRIELGDIDAAIRRYTKSATCTVYVEDKLISFIENHNSRTDHELRNWLSQQLPEYCLPDVIRGIETLPKNANDKIDVRRLQEIILTSNLGAVE